MKHAAPERMSAVVSLTLLPRALNPATVAAADNKVVPADNRLSPVILKSFSFSTL